MGVRALSADDRGRYSVYVGCKTKLSFCERQSFFIFEGDIGDKLKLGNEVEGLLKELLLSNMGMIRDSSDVLCLDPSDGQVHLVRSLKKSILTFDSLQQELDSFINNLETWSNIIDNVKRGAAHAGFPLFSYR